MKLSFALSILLILFAGGVYAENSDKEFTCDLKNTILSTDLISGEKTTPHISIASKSSGIGPAPLLEITSSILRIITAVSEAL